MSQIYSGYTRPSGEKLYYEIITNESGADNGFDIFIEGATIPLLHQPEPFIPDPSKSYEENAKAMCKEMSETAQHTVTPTVNERLTNLESNVDYLMLLNDSTEE